MTGSPRGAGAGTDDRHDRIVRVVRTVAAAPFDESTVPYGEDRADAALAGFDSLALVQLLVALECEFTLTIPSSAVVRENFASVAALRALVGTPAGATPTAPGGGG
ncbi:phosphopantetheine-binding protein [Streptomyces avermitilis]|uniref:phosphopantetheine-binding protein n=1 Tax=Streptomyces avermitilis TaxID=33903 RepID=UPI0033B9EDA0